MPETKKYCTPLHKEDIVPMSESEFKDLLVNILEVPTYFFRREDAVEDVWEERSKDTEFGITDESTPQPTCETIPKSIGCKVLGDQFIYAIQGLITDLESTKPPGYILAVGKLKGAIIKLQAGD